MVKPWSALIAIALYVVGHSAVFAQGERDIPFDMSGVPSVEDVEALLELSGALNGLSTEAKQRKIEYTTKYIALSYFMSASQIYQSCQTEIDQYCSAEPKENTDTCLLAHHDNLSTCCAANVRKMTGTTGIPKPLTYKGVNLPIGSELYFYDDCQLNQIDLSEDTLVGGLMVGAGRLKLNRSGNLASAFITDGQIYNGMPIANGTDHGTEFHESGVPKELIIAGDVKYYGMHLNKGSKVEFHENGALKSVMTKKSFVDGHGRQLTGRVNFHSSGSIKSALLAEAWQEPSIDVPKNSRVTFTSDGGFESVRLSHEEGFIGAGYVAGQIETHANGQIKRLYLADQSGVVLAGVAYPQRTTIEFSEDGRVVRDNFRDTSMLPSYPMPHYEQQWHVEELLKPMKIGVWELPANSILATDQNGIRQWATLVSDISFKEVELLHGHINFDSGGKIFWNAKLKKPYQNQGLEIPAGARVSVTIDGLLRTAYAQSRTYLNTNSVVPDTTIDFHKEGMIRKITLEKGAELFGFRFSKTVDVQFSKLGKIYTLFTDEPVSINELKLDGDFVFFHPDGSVRSGILNTDLRIDSVLFAAGTEIILNESGDVIHSWRREPRWPNGAPPKPKDTTNATNQDTFTVMVSPERATRMPLMGPFSVEQCFKLFGQQDASGNYEKQAPSGFSMGMRMTPAQFGCGITDEQAGILDRG